MEKHYLDFIKGSTKFYRGYIQRLASNFSGVPELLQIAQKFDLNSRWMRSFSGNVLTSL